MMDGAYDGVHVYHAQQSLHTQIYTRDYGASNLI